MRCAPICCRGGLPSLRTELPICWSSPSACRRFCRPRRTTTCEPFMPRRFGGSGTCCFFFTLVAPSFYVATISFHPEAVPTEQLFTFASSREWIPLPSFVETVLMELAFEAVWQSG